MSEVLSYQVGGKAEQDVELLVNHLADWLEEEHGKNLVFHTFSNTGWLTYGVALEKFHKQDPSLIGRIKGCIVDSAPVASPDPQMPTNNSNVYANNVYETPGLVQFPTDKVLAEDPDFRKYVQLYAKDEKVFFAHYADSHKKMSELGFHPGHPCCHSKKA